MKMQVAMIGSSGSGKTVLTAVMSKFLSGHDNNVFMRPLQTVENSGGMADVRTPTSIYVSRIIDRFHKGEWPAGTPLGYKCELGFALQINENEYPMKLLDSGGQDIKAISDNYDITALNPFQQRLLDYILSSNAVVLIVNLSHFVDTDTLEKDTNEHILQSAVDRLVAGGSCHYILICFTAYDKYKKRLDRDYGSSFTNYLSNQLPTFYRSCRRAENTVVCDYSEHGLGQKKIWLKCLPVAPVIAQRPGAEINPDKVGKPPIGFQVNNKQHSFGMQQIADWLYKCEQSERYWDRMAESAEGKKELSDILIYRLLPIFSGACVGFLAWLMLADVIAERSVDMLNSFLFGMPIGTGIGFLIGDKIRVLVKETDGLIFKKKRSDADNEEQQESVSSASYSTGTGGSSATSPSPSGSRKTTATSGSGEETFD